MDSPYQPLNSPGIGPVLPLHQPPKDHSKILLIILGASAGLLILLVIAALVWPRGQQKKPAPPPVQASGRYYFIDSYKKTTDATGSSVYSLGFVNPPATAVTTDDLRLDWPLWGKRALQLSVDGSTYLYAATPAPSTFQLIVGKRPQAKEKVVVTEQTLNDYRDYLLTADGKEVVYIDTVLNDKKEIASQTAYTIHTASGKSTKIGAVSRPLDRDNTPLFEVAKDQTVRFYTSLDDGIYETRYSRKDHSLTTTKVVLTNYDRGSMGPLSPDGTKLIYFGNSPAAAKFTLYLFDLQEGGVTPLLTTPAKYGGFAGGYWSPDSKSIIITSQLKDVDGAHYKNQLMTVDTTTKATKTVLLAENTSSGADNSTSLYRATSWSPDGRFLSYLQNNQLYFYDLTAKKVLTGAAGHAIDPAYTGSNGWIKKD